MADDRKKKRAEPLPPLTCASPGTATAETVPVDPGADVVRWLFPAYILMILVGFFALMGPGVNPHGNQLGPDRAAFMSVNAATLTGFQYSMHPRAYFLPGKVILLVLTVLGTLFSLIVGGMAVKRILRLPWPDTRIVTAALAIEVVVLLVGAVAAPPGNVLAGMFQAAAAWGNSGLHVDAPPGRNDVYTHVILLPLSILGGLGLVVLLQVLDRLMFRTPLLRHTRVVLQMTAALFLIGLVGGVILQVGTPRTSDEGYPGATRRPAAEMITNASISSVTARTAGMSIASPKYPRAMSYFVMLLMVVGASPGGTGGGLKTTTVWELVSAPRRLLRGGGGGGGNRTLGIAATWLGTYLIALAVFQMLLLRTQPELQADRLQFITVSALSNVGLSHDDLSMTGGSLLLVTAAMFFGKITPLLILWWMADTTKDADLAIG